MSEPGSNENLDEFLAPLNAVRESGVYVKYRRSDWGRESYVLVRWSCGHVSKPRVHDLYSGKTVDCNVPHCPARIRRGGGYRQSKPGTLYLCHRKVDGEIQRMYGITNQPDRRLTRHAQRGWTLIDRVDGDGQTIADAESIIKKYMKLNDLHASIYTGDDGETEAWSYDDLPADSINELIHILTKEHTYV